MLSKIAEVSIFKTDAALIFFAAERLEDLRKAAACGNLGAVIEALQICHDLGKVLPDWLAAANISVINDHIALNPSKGRGRTASYQAKNLEAEKDLMIYRAVQQLHAEGNSFEESFELAPMALKGTPAGLRPETIKSRYWQVVREISKAEKGGRFWISRYRDGINLTAEEFDL